MTDQPTTSIAATEHEEWQRARAASVSGPAGNLALVSFWPVTDEPEQLEELPVTVRREGDADELLVRADAADGVTLDGKPVGGEVRWARLRPDGTPLLRWKGMTADAFSLDGSAFEVRIYDEQAANRGRFDRIDTYPYDPALAVEAEFVRDEVHSVQWEFSRTSDSGSTKQVPGKIRFELEGATRELVGFLDGPVLVIVFADGTTGRESYAPGRFLKVDIPESGTFVLDFNRAFIPPCGFSDFYSCPLPPAENRLDVPVRAGERRVLWKDGDVSGGH